MSKVYRVPTRSMFKRAVRFGPLQRAPERIMSSGVVGAELPPRLHTVEPKVCDSKLGELHPAKAVGIGCLEL